MEGLIPKISNFEAIQTEVLIAILLVKTLLGFKHGVDKTYVKAHFAELLLIGFGSEKGEIEIEFIRTLYLYLYAVSGGITTEEIYEQIESIDNQNKTTVMENFIDELLEKGERIGEERGIQIGEKRGIQIGKEQGIQRGMEIGKKRAVYQAYQNGCSIAMLSNIFALSETEAQKIIDEVESWDKKEKA